MITEQGRVVSVEPDGLWVETANQSACGRCAARKGCGQSLLAQVSGHRTYIRAGLQNFSSTDFCEGDTVTIGVHEAAITRGSLLVYCMPLLGLIAGAGFATSVHLSEAGVLLSALLGLLLAGIAVRWVSRTYCSDERFQPVVIGRAESESVINLSLPDGASASHP